MSIGELGTLVRVPDGRIGTVVFNGLTGVGIKWGEHEPDPALFEGSCGDLDRIGVETNAEVDRRLEDWQPDAMLREPSLAELLHMPCVCTESEVEVIRYGLEGST